VQGRTLRRGPVIGIVTAIAAVVGLAIAFALRPAAAPKVKPDTSPTALGQAPVVPDAIRQGIAPSASVARGPAAPTVSARGRRAQPPAMPTQGPAVPFGRMLQEHARAQQDEKAASAGILFDAKGESGSGTSPPPAPAPAPAAASATVARAGTSGVSAAAGPLGLAGMLGTDPDPNQQERKNAFLDTQGGGKTSDYLTTSLQHPRSPFELKAGTIIPAVLVTGINSDLPGPVIGQVRESVYDTVTGNYLLVPQGSRLLATYDSMVVWGQERVLVCWNRLLFPNGDSVNLACMPAADLQGGAGLTDEVNEHWWRILKGAAVASLLAATSESLAGNVNNTSPTVPQLWASGAGTEINQVGQQITRRNIQVQPTITIRPGFSVNVIVTKDVVLPPYSAGAPRALAARP
jgi:type IV secretion system protein VirB10